MTGKLHFFCIKQTINQLIIVVQKCSFTKWTIISNARFIMYLFFHACSRSKSVHSDPPPPPICLQVSMATVITFHTFISTWHISYTKWPGLLVWGIQLSILSNCVWDRQTDTCRCSFNTCPAGQYWSVLPILKLHVNRNTTTPSLKEHR